MKKVSQESKPISKSNKIDAKKPKSVAKVIENRETRRSRV
jgi:hypothetical protein